VTWPDASTWLVIVVGGAATYAIRASFLAVADRFTGLSEDLREALRMVPAATLAALAIPALLRPVGPWAILGPRALAGVLAGLVAWRTRSVLATVVVGLLAVAVLEAVVG
jgi:branched-subunit amino acid transport protein